MTLLGDPMHSRNLDNFALLCLLTDGPLSMTELRLASGLTERTLRDRIRQLESEGYVTRRQDATNRRRVVVRLTDKGRWKVAQSPGSLSAVTHVSSIRTLRRAERASVRRSERPVHDTGRNTGDPNNLYRDKNRLESTIPFLNKEHSTNVLGEGVAGVTPRPCWVCAQPTISRRLV
jgi:DNA-binding MarR family transcriptional regulator